MAEVRQWTAIRNGCFERTFVDVDDDGFVLVSYEALSEMFRQLGLVEASD